MSFSRHPQADELVAFAEELADAARDLLSTRHESGRFETKEDASPVTEFDRGVDIHLHDAGALGMWEIARICDFTERYQRQGQLSILALPRIEQKGSVGVFWRKKDLPSLALSRFLHYLSHPVHNES